VGAITPEMTGTLGKGQWRSQRVCPGPGLPAFL